MSWSPIDSFSHVPRRPPLRRTITEKRPRRLTLFVWCTLAFALVGASCTPAGVRAVLCWAWIVGDLDRASYERRIAALGSVRGSGCRAARGALGPRPAPCRGRSGRAGRPRRSPSGCGGGGGSRRRGRGRDGGRNVGVAEFGVDSGEGMLPGDAGGHEALGEGMGRCGRATMVLSLLPARNSRKLV